MSPLLSLVQKKNDKVCNFPVFYKKAYNIIFFFCDTKDTDC